MTHERTYCERKVECGHPDLSRRDMWRPSKQVSHGRGSAYPLLDWAVADGERAQALQGRLPDICDNVLRPPGPPVGGRSHPPAHSSPLSTDPAFWVQLLLEAVLAPTRRTRRSGRANRHPCGCVGHGRRRTAVNMGVQSEGAWPVLTKTQTLRRALAGLGPVGDLPLPMTTSECYIVYTIEGTEVFPVRMVSVRALRERLGEVWDALETASEVVVTSNGKPIALITRTSESSLEADVAAVRRARAELALQALQDGSVRSGRSSMTDDEIGSEIRAVRRERQGRHGA